MTTDPTTRLPARNDAAGWQWLTLVVALMPIVSVNANYWLSASAGHIPQCLTYLEGCTSISATGRYGVSYWLFKLFMLPQALLLAVFWRGLDATLPRQAGRNVMLWAGLVGAVFLVLYTVFLGSQGELYRLMRRYGIFVFFLGTLIAQIAATRRLARARAGAPLRLQQGLLVAMGVFVIAELPLGTFGLQDDRAENVIEWNYSLLMQLWFLTWVGVRGQARGGQKV